MVYDGEHWQSQWRNQWIISQSWTSMVMANLPCPTRIELEFLAYPSFMIVIFDALMVDIAIVNTCQHHHRIRVAALLTWPNFAQRQGVSYRGPAQARRDWRTPQVGRRWRPAWAVDHAGPWNHPPGRLRGGPQGAGMVITCAAQHVNNHVNKQSSGFHSAASVNCLTIELIKINGLS